MPQKKNPDAAELLRAKAPRVVGRLTTLHGVLHGLPLTYNKDLQEDKEQLFDAIDSVELCLEVAQAMLASITFNRERMAAAAADEFPAATDIADLLVKRGVPFRQAHGTVGAVVRAAVERGKQLSELDRDELAELAPGLDDAYYELLQEGAWLESKRSEGGTAQPRVRDQLAQARHILDETRGVTVRPRSLPGRVLRPPGAGRGARPGGLPAPPRRHGGPDRGDRGLPPHRARLPRPRRADPAHPGAARRPGPGLRLPLLRHPRPAERRLRGRGRRGRGAHPRGRARGGPGADGPAPRAQWPSATCATGRASSPRPWASGWSSTAAGSTARS